MSKILFTGAATPTGGYMVAKLKEACHEVFTVGKGDTYNLDFRYLGADAVKMALNNMRSRIGKPDVVVHNARLSDPGNINHILFANINARILIDNLALNEHYGTDTPFRSIHISGWGPEWGESRAEIFVSNAAQQAIPAALVLRRQPLTAAQEEENHRRELAKMKHKAQQDQAEKLHDEKEQQTLEWYANNGEEYEKKSYEREPFCDTFESTWVPNVDAFLMQAHPDDRDNGRITRETLSDSLLYILGEPHSPGILRTEIVTPATS